MLADLTFNHKPIITSLSMLAGEHKGAASSIVAEIRQRILECPAQQKLFALFLIDSIVKNVGQPYIDLFSRILPEVFMNVWNADPQSRPTLQKLLTFWKGYFSETPLGSIRMRLSAQQSVVARPATRQSAAAAAAFNAQPHAQAPRVLDPRRAAITMDPRVAHAAPAPYVAPPVMAGAGYGATTPFTAPPSPPSRSTSTGLPRSPGPQASYPAALPQYTAATGYAAPAPQQFPVQQPRQLSPQPMQPAGAFPGFPQLQAGGNPPTQLPPAGGLPPFQAGIAPVQPSTALEALQALRVKQEQKSSAVPQQPSVSRASEDDYYEGLTAEELPLKPVNKRKMDFSSDRLKAEDPKVVQELMACTKALRPLHLDRRFHHNKRMRGAGRRVLSQQWYVGADDWVAGTAAPTQATPAFFDLPGKAVVKKEAMSVPVDDAQPTCALSGERFETFWDDASEEWRYRDAVRLDAEQAARHGLHEGVIVKVNALNSASDVVVEEEEEAAADGQPAYQDTAPVAYGGTAGESAGTAVQEEVAVEAADTVEGVDQQAAAASVPEAREALLQLPTGVTVKREPEEETPGRTAKRIKTEP
ncbi:g3227 [Coccomyxa elongata]